MKTTEINELSVADLQEKIEAAKADMVRLKFNHATSPVENPSVLKKNRRDIARMMTILKQKQTVNK